MQYSHIPVNFSVIFPKTPGTIPIANSISENKQWKLKVTETVAVFSVELFLKCAPPNRQPNKKKHRQYALERQTDKINIGCLRGSHDSATFTYFSTFIWWECSEKYSNQYLTGSTGTGVRIATIAKWVTKRQYGGYTITETKLRSEERSYGYKNTATITRTKLRLQE